jgi:hypothetical protein
MNTSSDRAAWRQAVADVAAKASEKMPESIGRITAAVKLALAGDVDLLPDGGAMVASRTKAGTEYFVVNGTCECPDFQRAPGQFCAHRLAYGLVVRANELVAQPSTEAPVCDSVEEESQTVPATSQTPPPPEVPTPEVPPGIDPRFLTYLHGKPFIKYVGLLALAHAKGLVSLKARFISVTPELALAEAEATFADGHTYSESADSTLENVPAHIRPHYPRMALTRSKARALRDALNLGVLTALEELDASDEEGRR